MSLIHYMVVENETNLIVASHVWLSTDESVLPDTYNNTKHTYVQHDKPIIGGTYNPVDGTIIEPIFTPMIQVDSIPIVDPVIDALHAKIASQASDIATLHASITQIINQLNINTNMQVTTVPSIPSI